MVKLELARRTTAVSQVLRAISHEALGPTPPPLRPDLGGPRLSPGAITFGRKNEYTLKVAGPLEDRLKAWALTYEMYISRGYAKPNDQKLWYSLYDALPDTTTFLAECEGQAVGTLSVVPDSHLGLPADTIFSEQLDRMRNRGRSMCELVSLACLAEGMAGTEIVKHLFKLVYLSARMNDGATDFVITVNPKHAFFYERVLLMNRLSDEVSYAKVEGHAAMLFHLDLLEAPRRYQEQFGKLPGSRNLHRFFLESAQELATWVHLCRTPLEDDDLRHYFCEARPLAAPAELERILHAHKLRA
ncbi:MAG: hypothetical protein KIS92_16590 [Planctomycetota bacterium]|nr:hypothetical protein [Planctomycetota bacterium]